MHWIELNPCQIPNVTIRVLKCTNTNIKTPKLKAKVSNFKVGPHWIWIKTPSEDIIKILNYKISIPNPKSRIPKVPPKVQQIEFMSNSKFHGRIYFVTDGNLEVAECANSNEYSTIQTSNNSFTLNIFSMSACAEDEILFPSEMAEKVCKVMQILCN